MTAASRWFGPILLVGMVMALAWALLAFLWLPVGQLILHALLPGGQWPTEAIQTLAASPRVLRSITDTLVVTVATLVTVSLVGIFQVIVLEVIEVKGARILALIYLTPLVFSSVAAVTGYTFVYGAHGVVTNAVRLMIPDADPRWFQGLWAIVFVHTFTMTQYHVLFFRAAVRRVDYGTIETARCLGCSPLGAIRHAVLPAVLPSLMSVSLIVMLHAMTSFAAPVILGGRGVTLLNPLIQTLMSLRSTDLAALLAMGLGLVSMVVFLVVRRIDLRNAKRVGTRTPAAMRKLRLASPAANTLVHVLAYALAAIQIAPIVLTAILSFAPTASILNEPFPTTFTFNNYRAVFSDVAIASPLATSLVLSAVGALLAFAAAMSGSLLLRRWRGWPAGVLEFSLFLPWILPTSVIALGLITAYGAPSAMLFGQALVGSWWSLPVAYAIFALPLMVRMLGAGLSELDPSLVDAARSLGAGSGRALFKVQAPLLAPVIILVIVMAFQEGLAEYTMSAFLYNVNNVPLGVALRNAAASDDPEQIARSLVYIVLLTGFSFAIVALANRFGFRNRSTGR